MRGFENYRLVFTGSEMPRYLLNSVLITLPTVIGAVALSAMTGFALGVYRFRGNLLIFFMFVAGNFVPFQILMVPVRELTLSLGLYDTKTGLVLFHIAFQTGFCTLFMRNFIRALPFELIEAARVEGVSEWRIFWFVVLPLMKPAMAALAVLIFTFIWNDYFWAVVLTQGSDSQPVTAGITSFNAQYRAAYHLMSAGSLVAALPACGDVLPHAAPLHRWTDARRREMTAPLQGPEERIMTRIAFVGAGSTVFMRHILGDTLHHPALCDATFALMDVDGRRLAQSEAAATRLIAAMGSAARVEATTERARALDGADFVVVCFQIGGYRPCTVTDFEVPRRHGLRQTIADTLGVGGIMRGLRTVPHLWAVAEDMTRLCPDALMMNYVNPMAINTWALAERFPWLRQVGLCHSVEHTAAELAADLGIERASMRYRVGGINHMAFFLHLEAEGREPLSAASGGVPLRPPARAHRRQPALPQPRALRGDGAPRLLPDRILGALRRVRAVVHQAGPPRPDRALRHPARRVSPPLRGADRRVGCARRDRGGAPRRFPTSTPRRS